MFKNVDYNNHMMNVTEKNFKVGDKVFVRVKMPFRWDYANPGGSVWAKVSGVVNKVFENGDVEMYYEEFDKHHLERKTPGQIEKWEDYFEKKRLKREKKKQ